MFSNEKNYQSQLTLVASILLEISARKSVKTDLQEIFQIYLGKKNPIWIPFLTVPPFLQALDSEKKQLVNNIFPKEEMNPREMACKADSHFV